MMGEAIRALRTAANMTVAELAKKSGIKSRVIRSWERGERVPRVDRAKRLSDALGVGVEKLFTAEADHD